MKWTWEQGGIVWVTSQGQGVHVGVLIAGHDNGRCALTYDPYGPHECDLGERALTDPPPLEWAARLMTRHAESEQGQRAALRPRPTTNTGPDVPF